MQFLTVFISILLHSPLMNSKNYTPFFCEENIWHLVNNMELEDQLSSSILFITNEFKTCALMNQKASKVNELVIWDYHVILHNRKENTIFDYDTRLGETTCIEDYFTNTFGDQSLLSSPYKSYIIPISGKDYINKFSSDRSHMLDEHGHQLQKFPEWPAILSKHELNLATLMDLGKNLISGYQLLSVDEYLQKYL